MRLCCPSIVAQRRFSGRSPTVNPSPGSQPCASTPASTLVTYSCSAKSRSGLKDTAETLGPKLASIGADLMVETLRGLENGQVRPTPQDHAQATLAPILNKEDGRMDFSRSATDLFNRLRGFQPWPGAFTTFKGKTLQVHRAQPVGTCGHVYGRRSRSRGNASLGWLRQGQRP